MRYGNQPPLRCWFRAAPPANGGAVHGVSSLASAILAADLDDPGNPFPLAGCLLSLFLVEFGKWVKIDLDGRMLLAVKRLGTWGRPPQITLVDAAIPAFENWDGL